MSKQLIYIVDDEPLITRLAQINLERAGYTVQMANNGMEALEALQSKLVQPDLILMDVMMPYMNGFELTYNLQADAELSKIPIIIMTARSRDEDILMGQELGAKHYLMKPIKPSDLVSMVTQVLKQESSPSE